MAEYIEAVKWSDTLSEALEPCNVVFVDVDDVIVTPWEPDVGTYVGSSVWAIEHFKKHAHEYTRQELVEHFYNALDAAAFSPVDSQLNAFLSELATEKPVLGLTARVPSYAEKTKLQCQSAGMFFTQQTIEGLVDQGLISAGYNIDTLAPNDKGLAALQWVNTVNDTPIHTVCSIDDSLRNLAQMAHAMEAEGISVIGIHFRKVAYQIQEQYLPEELDLLAETQFAALKSNPASLPKNSEIIAEHRKLALIGNIDIKEHVDEVKA